MKDSCHSRVDGVGYCIERLGHGVNFDDLEACCSRAAGLNVSSGVLVPG